MTKFNRRTVLKMLGATSVGAALPWLGSTQAKAQAGAVPLRILFVELGHGARRTTWEPPEVGQADPPSTQVLESAEWSLRPVMAALEPYKERITMFQNLDMVSQKHDPSQAANAHIDGGTHMVVAADRYMGTGDLGGGVSIDQLIAERLNQDQLLTRLRSLEVGAREHSGPYSNIQNEHYYAVPGQKLPFVTHVPEIWNHIFPEPLTSDVEEQARILAKKTSVYNYVRGDYERLVARLGVHDREKIQRMLDLRAELQESLTLVNNREANRPDEQTTLSPWEMLNEGYQNGNGNNRLWYVKVPLVGKMVGAALHTDTTRVATLSIELPPSYEFGYTPGSSFDGTETTDWHDLTHKVSGDNPDLTSPDARQYNDEMERLCYVQLANLLAELASLPETDGGTMLDHTLVVVHSHIAEGSHDTTRLPWMVIGDAQGALQMGRYIRFPITHRDNVNQIGSLQYPTDSGDRIYNYRGRPHNDLFTTLTHAMGVPVDDFGRNLPETKGVITEMLA